MKKILFTSLVLICFYTAKTQAWQWARYGVTFDPFQPQITEKQQVAVDNQGNTYLLGRLDGLLAWDDAAGPSDFYSDETGSDGYIAKFNKDGGRLWSHHIISQGEGREVSVGDMWIDSRGVEFIVNYKDELRFNSNGYGDNWDGHYYSWPGEYVAASVTAYPDGFSGVYASAMKANVWDIRGITIKHDQLNNTYHLLQLNPAEFSIEKYLADGQGLQWIQSGHNTASGNVAAIDMTVTPSGKIFVTGRIDGTARFGDYIITGSNASFIASIQNGTWAWAKLMQDATGNPLDGASAMCETDNGPVVCGNSFIIQYNEDGTIKWVAKPFYGAFAAQSITVDKKSHGLYVGLKCNVAFRFDGVDFPSKGHIFLINPDGKLVRYMPVEIGRVTNYEFNDLATDYEGNLYVSGISYHGSISFGNHNVGIDNTVNTSFVFAAKAKSLFKVTAPNDGATLPAKSALTFSWQSDLLGQMIIEYSLNGGQSWTNIATVPATQLNYSWTTPDIDADNCLVRVRSSLADISEQKTIFIYKTFKVISPVATDIWTDGGNRVSWVDYNGGGSLYNVEYLNGTTWKKFASNVSGTTCTGVINLPCDAVTGTRVRVKRISNNEIVYSDIFEAQDGPDNDCQFLTNTPAEQDNLKNGFIIYPNPTENILQIQHDKLAGAKTIKVSVQRLNGLYEEAIPLQSLHKQSNNVWQLNVQHLQPGWYALVLYTDSGTYTQKFEKK